MQAQFCTEVVTVVSRGIMNHAEASLLLVYSNNAVFQGYKLDCFSLAKPISSNQS